MLPSRPCRFCLSLQGGSVFADFDVDPNGRVFAVRVSFDGYGCCHTPTIGRMSATDSAALLAMVEANQIGPAAGAILRTYFRANRDVIWDDALKKHRLIQAENLRDEHFEHLQKSAATFFARWRDSHAVMFELTEGHKTLSIVIRRPGTHGNLVVSCGSPVYIRGPVRWSNPAITFARVEIPGEGEGIAVRDEKAGLEVLCVSASVAENVKLYGHDHY